VGCSAEAGSHSSRPPSSTLVVRAGAPVLLSHGKRHSAGVHRPQSLANVCKRDLKIPEIGYQTCNIKSGPAAFGCPINCLYYQLRGPLRYSRSPRRHPNFTILSGCRTSTSTQTHRPFNFWARWCHGRQARHGGAVGPGPVCAERHRVGAGHGTVCAERPGVCGPGTVCAEGPGVCGRRNTLRREARGVGGPRNSLPTLPLLVTDLVTSTSMASMAWDRAALLYALLIVGSIPRGSHAGTAPQPLRMACQQAAHPYQPASLSKGAKRYDGSAGVQPNKGRAGNLGETRSPADKTSPNPSQPL
jgi:hypothetical protein